MVLESGSPQGEFHLLNQSDHALQVQVDVQCWSQQDNRNVQTASADFIVSPRFATLPAGGMQVVRVALRHPLAATTELSYRIAFRELPRQAGLDSDVLLNYSVPLFLEPVTAVSAALNWSLSTAPGTLSLHVSNHGGRHAKLHLVSLNYGGMARQVPDQSPRYVLPGASREVQWHLPARRGERAVLTVEIDSKVQQIPLIVQ